MPSILEYSKYSALATASYVRLGAEVDTQQASAVTGARFSEVAAEQGRLPISQAQYLFDSANTFGAPVWNVAYYYGGDVPGSIDSIAARDISGFGATLFERNGEKVLALRGTEPTSGLGVDLFSADLGQIGILGLALTQVVSMANLITRLRAPKGTYVPQVNVHASLAAPATANYVQAEGIGGTTVYLAFEGSLVQGLGVLDQSDHITVTGHSLGGHLAYMAARLFPGVVNQDVYAFDSAGYDPVSTNVIGQLAGPTPLGN